MFAQTYKSKVEAEIVTKDVTALLGPDRPAAPKPPTDGASGLPVNILLMGVDDRSGANAAIAGEKDGILSDTTLLVHLSADRERVDVVSIPRDTVVRFADCDRSDGTSQRGWTDKFNTAFGTGAAHGSITDGAACTIKTVERLTDIFIDHFVVVDMAGFANVVDAVGGVPVCLPRAYSDAYSTTQLPAGPQVLHGITAVNYARMRKGEGLSGSDLDRIDRQQEFLKNLASKVLSAEMLYRPQELTNFIKATAGSLTMDDGLGSVDSLAGLAFSLRDLDPATNFTFATAPVVADPANPKVTVVFTSKATSVWGALKADQPIAPLLDDQSNSPANEDVVTVEPSPGTTGGSQAASEEEILNACTAG